MITYSATVVPLPVSANMTSNFDERLMEAFRLGRLKLFYIAAKDLSTVPANGDLVTYNSSKWELMGVTALNPAGTPVIYTALAMEGGRT